MLFLVFEMEIICVCLVGVYGACGGAWVDEE